MPSSPNQKSSSPTPNAAANGARSSVIGSNVSLPPSQGTVGAEKNGKEAAAQSSKPRKDDVGMGSDVAGLSRPVLRSVPHPSSSDAIKVDADWTATTPMSPVERSARIKEIMAAIPSPPNELDPDVMMMKEEPTVTSAPDSMLDRPLPAQKPPLDKLSFHWKECARPVQSVSRKYLNADGVFGLVDVSICEAMENANDKSNALWCRTAFERFKQTHKGQYRVPPNIRCDRTFLQHPNDALYVDKVSEYLFNDTASSTPPILDDPALYEVYVPAARTKTQENRFCWAVGAVRKRVITFDDFFVIRRPIVELGKALVLESGEDSPITIPWDILPTMPTWLQSKVDLRSAPVPQIRALVYFAHKARVHGIHVFQKWQKLLQFEVAMHVTVAHYASWAHPVLEQPKVWFPPAEHVAWLKEFESFPPIPAFFEGTGKYVSVSVKQVVKVLESALARAKPVSRRDYCTRSHVKYVIAPNAHIYVDDPLCEASMHVQASDAAASLPPTDEPAPVPTPIAEIPAPTPAPNPEAVVLGRIVKKAYLRDSTKMPKILINSLNGNGPWTLADVLNHVVANERRVNASNSTLTTTVSELRNEMGRLRDDVARYRGDSMRYQTECQELRAQVQRNQQLASSPPVRRFGDNPGYPSNHHPVGDRRGPEGGPRDHRDEPRPYGHGYEPYDRYGRRY